MLLKFVRNDLVLQSPQVTTTWNQTGRSPFCSAVLIVTVSDESGVALMFTAAQAGTPVGVQYVL